MSTTDFVPRWASPPGDTIREALDEQRLDPATLAARLHLSGQEFESFLDGQIPLTIRLAERLTSAIGGSVEFWMTRDGQFRADKSRVAADEWVQQMPLKEMINLGWIAPDTSDWVQQIDACLDFFDVRSSEIWEDEREELSNHTRFRSSPRVTTNEYAVSAWLRKCEIELSEIDCRDWDAGAFAALLPQLLPLTRESDPQHFLPELQNRCAEVGVAVGVIRAPRGCPVSGAARRLSSGQPSIALSGRYRVDEHLWFTFFHEAAHLLLHDDDALYLDEIEPDSSPQKSAIEAEADDFAGELLVPKQYENRLARATRRPIELRGIADEIGVGEGILVGHLQHRRLLGYNTKFNRLKRRYNWNGPNLEMA